MYSIRCLALVALLGIALASPLAGATTTTYSEDFLTTTYKDPLSTTVYWNSLGGNIQLYPFAPTLVGASGPTSDAEAIAIDGNYAYVADGPNGLIVFDITNPAAPTLVGSYNTPNYALDVAVAGDVAYVADNTNGLMAFNITNPASPVLVGLYDTPSYANAVAIAGNRAYVADGNSGLQVIDITNPTSLSLVGAYNTTGSAIGVVVAGDHAFVADDLSGLAVIDITNPATPTLTGIYNTPGRARDVVVAGDLAFVADFTSGLQVIDITNLASPTLVGTLNTPDRARNVAVDGDLAFVADGNSGLQMIDITNPANPVLIASYDTIHAREIAIAGEHAFVADANGGLKIIDIGDAMPSVVVGTYTSPGGSIFDIAVDGNLAFAGFYFNTGFRILDITNPAVPTSIGAWSTANMYSTMGVEVDGNTALLAVSDAAGLLLLDITNPTMPALLGSYNQLPTNYRDVAVAGNVAFLANHITGVRIMNIADPTNPTLMSTYNTAGAALAVEPSGNHLFVADNTNGLVVLDITNPAIPTLVSGFNMPGNALSLVLSGNLAYVVTSPDGLMIIDITNPSNPSLVGRYTTPGTISSVSVAGDLAFVGDGYGGMHILDITNPASPVLLESHATVSWAGDVELSGEYVFLRVLSPGIEVLKVRQHQFNTTNNVAQSLAVDGASDTIVRARLTSTETVGVTWELSANSGANWSNIAPNDPWTRIGVPGNELLWRTTHTLMGVNPTVSNLTLEWLNQSASISSLGDVPNDQGGWLRMIFQQSGYDFSDETGILVTGYQLYRRVDNANLRARAKKAPPMQASAEMGGSPYASFDRNALHQLGDRQFLVGPTSSKVGTLPAGTWEFVSFLAASQQDGYVALLPTAADSSASGTNRSTYFLTTHTTNPLIWFSSQPDSGYSVDNIAPGMPKNLVAAYKWDSGNQLSWDPAPESDFQYFRVYRGTDPAFIPSPGNLITATTLTTWTDPGASGNGVHYKITAVDNADNESAPAMPSTVTALPPVSLPGALVLHQNHPNPFNPITSIRFDIPADGVAITLQIFDVGGRLVKTLVDGVQTAGHKSVTWDGRSSDGLAVASGVYYSRLSAPGIVQTKKLVLSK